MGLDGLVWAPTVRGRVRLTRSAAVFFLEKNIYQFVLMLNKSPCLIPLHHCTYTVYLPRSPRRVVSPPPLTARAACQHGHSKFQKKKNTDTVLMPSLALRSPALPAAACARQSLEAATTTTLTPLRPR